MICSKFLKSLCNSIADLNYHAASAFLGVVDDVHFHGLCADKVCNAEGAELPLVKVEVTDGVIG